ncbi:cysteine--1-D-myo-inosityl 2-amino-2-deoxy-alpha-D-glucopyranoside ligase [Paenarthrobacter sp. PH39-S1]|uniref:cysteine--1-D-myo-inosityl 2-amino-2-deoxy-alpha-D-glucopyranoside ligase n=1 Tax=Paenarthrobacter sp. PH39-S1 TaxID=3046204 RepID=UPI0024B9DDCB|nr:cysteine--1-D-myo-inosityl 2-amino-2-deoxy-alpha-D-glucopyranoside ligase [Paenarthrobacter sp. PH39-S1]MDJ0356763.1 cysteine--1-D-myo-inosityl 2-amino-2-deoxy-alpha-D-glucopyranoside ligase [Paenarthrobacter sp. PH39-S1]
MKSWNSRPVPQLAGSMAALSLHETSSGAVRPLPVQDSASMYVCGITPYDATHIGHAATYVAFDLLNRAWRDAGQSVSYVQNVTDVDDPLLERAVRDGVDWRELAVEQTDLFRADMEALNVLAPEHYIGAVESIEWIVPQVERLVAAGLAYSVPGSDGEPSGDIYFSVEAASTPAAGGTHDGGSVAVGGTREGAAVAVRAADDGAWWLGQVSGLTPQEMLPVFAERGGDPDRAGKRNALDPLLWRVAREGEPCWSGATLGAGRPGWHIECTVIAQRFLPVPFTVQGGGSDLVFPHHEMGAGHAYALSGIEMARHYVHTGMVGLDGEKMSKSKGNLVLVSKLRAGGVDPVAIRLAILAHHYRSDWCWTDGVLAEAKERLLRWRQALVDTRPGSAAALVSGVRAALAADLDAPRALAVVDRWAAAQPASGTRPADRHSGLDSAVVTDALEALLGVVVQP